MKCDKCGADIGTFRCKDCHYFHVPNQQFYGYCIKDESEHHYHALFWGHEACDKFFRSRLNES